MPDPLPEEFEAALAGSADRRGPYGQPIVFLFETDSTNDVAAVLADRGAREGTTVLALAQRAGRGRLGRTWFSPAGAGLYASVVCRGSQRAPLLTLAGGVAVAEGIRRATGLPAVIKWPNDIVVEDGPGRVRWRKLSGILAEGSSNAQGLQHVVLGFGVNLRPAGYPPAIAATATSIESELGRPVDPGAVLAEILVGLNEQIQALDAGRSAEVLDRWRGLAPSSAGSRVEIGTPDSGRQGTTCGIDETGALRVRVDDRIERVIAGEVKWL